MKVFSKDDFFNETAETLGMGNSLTGFRLSEFIHEKPIGISYPLDRYRPVLVYRDVYLINFYDEKLIIYYDKKKDELIESIHQKISASFKGNMKHHKTSTTIEIKACSLDYSENEVNIENKHLLSYLDTIQPYFKPGKRPSLLSMAFKCAKYDHKCIGKYNVTDYLAKFGLEVQYKTKTLPLASFDIRTNLEKARSISSTITGELMENLLISVLSNPSIDFQNAIEAAKKGVVRHIRGYTMFTEKEKLADVCETITDHVFLYIKEVARNLNFHSFSDEHENAYHTLTNSFCIRSSPDLIANENELYDIKVRSVLGSSPKQLFLYARGFEQNYGPLHKCGIINLFTNELILYEFDDLHQEIKDSPVPDFMISKYFDYHIGRDEYQIMRTPSQPFPPHKLEIVYCYGTIARKKKAFHEFIKTRDFVLDDPSTNFDRIWKIWDTKKKEINHAINTCQWEITTFETLTKLEKERSVQCSLYAISLSIDDDDVEFLKKFNYEKVFLLREIPIPETMKPYVVQYVDLDQWNYDDYERPISETLRRSRIGKYINIKSYKRKVYEDEEHHLYYRYGPNGKNHMEITSLMISLDDLFTESGDNRIKWEDE